MSQTRRYYRYAILLFILFAVAANEYWVQARTASWAQSLKVRIYAINGDGSDLSAQYIRSLRLADFKPIEEFLNREAMRHGLKLDALQLDYAEELDTLPPQPPLETTLLGNIAWSLKFRAWALYWGLTASGSGADINLFVNYYNTAQRQTLPHSVGLRGGMIALIHGFAEPSYNGSNNVVIAHEIMHTLGASDKYTASTQPVFPSGFAEPYLSPLYPQSLAEIMGGRIPLSASDVRMPASLAEVVVGAYTAAEVNWYQP